jgi:hypothetical protein
MTCKAGASTKEQDVLFGIEIAKRNLAVIIGIITMVVLLISFLAPVMTANAANADAVASNVATDVSNIRYVETVAENLGEPIVTDFTNPLPGGIKFTHTAGDKDTILAGASGYVIVTKDESGEVFVSTSTMTKSLGVVTKPVAVAELSALPVDPETVARTVDQGTVHDPKAISTTPSTSDALKTVLTADFASATNWLTSLTHSA